MLLASKRLWDWLRLRIALAAFAVICLAWTVLALPLFHLLPRRFGLRVGRRAISTGFRLYVGLLRTLGVYRVDLSELDALRMEPAMILAANHPSLIDAVLILSRHPNMVCVMKSALQNNPLLGAGARLAGYVDNESPRRMIRQAVGGLQEGGHLLLFPEGTRSPQGSVGPLRSAIGVIARLAEVPVQTVLIEMDAPFLTKGWPVTRCVALPVTCRIRLGKRFAPSAEAADLVEQLQQYFDTEVGAT